MGESERQRSDPTLFQVLTDDNCLYYFKSPKDMSALGMVLLPSYTITTIDPKKSVGGRPFAFKAFNRYHDGEREYEMAADSEEEMKVWMNVMSLASIAFGSGKASAAKADTGLQALADDHVSDFEVMQKRAMDRAGGVTGSDDTVQHATTITGGVPHHLQLTAATKKKGGPTLCLIKLLDGETLQLYAESSTTGAQFMDQICLMLNCHERYYFGIAYKDAKGDEDWIKDDKKILKHDYGKAALKGTHLELEFKIR